MNTSGTSEVDDRFLELARELDAIARDAPSNVSQRAERCALLYQRLHEFEFGLAVSKIRILAQSLEGGKLAL